MIKAKIDVKKISKPDLYVGKKGTYLDIVLMPNRDGTDEYGYDGFIIQEISKAEREAGRKGPIIGNYREVNATPKPAPQPPPSYMSDALDESDDVPF